MTTQSPSAMSPELLPQDVIRLVIAARKVAFGDASPSPEDMLELDRAAEAFADRVPWQNEPDGESA
jgi:hypothetical protein